MDPVSSQVKFLDRARQTNYNIVSIKPIALWFDNGVKIYNTAIFAQLYKNKVQNNVVIMP